MIPMIALGASGIAAAVIALMNNKENEEGFTGNEAILFNKDSDVTPEVRKAVKKLAATAEGVLQQVREHISQTVPDDFSYSLSYGRDDEIALTWRYKETGITPRLPRIVDDSLWGVLKQLQLVDWDHERTLAEASERTLHEFCDKCNELQG